MNSWMFIHQDLSPTGHIHSWKRELGLPSRRGKGGAPILPGPLLPGDSLRTTRGGTQSGSWVQGPRAPLTYDLGQISAHPSSYLFLTRSCDEGTILVPSLQQRESRPREKGLTSGHTGVTGKPSLSVGRSPSGSPPGLLLPGPTSTPMSIQNRNGVYGPWGHTFACSSPKLASCHQGKGLLERL